MKCWMIEKITNHNSPEKIGVKKRAVLKKHLKECPQCRVKYQKKVIFGMVVGMPYQKYNLKKFETIITSFISLFLVLFMIIGAGILCYIHYKGINSNVSNEAVILQQEKKGEALEKGDTTGDGILTINTEESENKSE